MDSDPSTKWFAGSKPSAESPIYAVYTLSEAALVTGYTMVSGNDESARDPKAWTVLATNSASVAGEPLGTGWTVIDSRSGQTFSGRTSPLNFTTSASISYKYFQLRITANRADSGGSNDNVMQLSDWKLRSGVAGFSSSLITADTEWSYLEDGTVDPAGGDTADRTKWTKVGATLPGTWKTAKGSFGAKRSGGSATVNVGSGYQANTLLKYFLNYASDSDYTTVPAYFFRYQFELDSAAVASINGLYGTIVHDDAATVYLNGKNVADFPGTNVVTSNLGYGGNNNTDPATEQLLFPTKGILQSGTNVLSVELHNVNATSSDVYFAMPSLAATSDTVAEPFTSAQTSYNYSSNTVSADFFTDLLYGFDDIKNTPSIIAKNESGPDRNGSNTLTAANDRVVVETNNAAVGSESAKVAKREQAYKDSVNDSKYTMVDGLGSVLGPIYLEALNAGELPKTKWVLSNTENNSYEAANNSAKGHWSYQRPMNRLGFSTGGTCSGGAFTGTTGWIQVTSQGGTGDYNGLCRQGSFPSGHTLHGYTNGTTLATLLPELSPQIMLRASEYGNNRLVLGFHYPMDVMAGRINGQAVVANRWSDTKFRELLQEASQEVHDVLSAKCVSAGYSADIEKCAEADSSLPSDEESLNTYEDRLTYSAYTTIDGVRHSDGFPQLDKSASDLAPIVPDSAADVLLGAFPDLTLAQRKSILSQTAVKGGYALDQTKAGKASWQRLNFAAAMVADVSVASDGNVVVEDSASASQPEVKVDGTVFSGFVEGTTQYTVTLPAGSTQAPEVYAYIPGAVVTVTQAASATGAATITVKPIGSTTTTTYTVNFQVAPQLSSKAELSVLQVDGVAVAGFSSSNRQYSVELPAGTTAVPAVTATAAENGTVAITQATSVTGAAVVTVTSEDGTATSQYVVQFSVKAGDNGGGDNGGGNNGGGNNGETVVAAVTVTATPTVTYNRAATVNVNVTAKDVVPSGRIVVTTPGVNPVLATLRDGKATVTLPKSLAVGKHSVTVQYVPAVGGKVVAPASASVLTFTVTKAKAAKPAVKITKGKRNAKTAHVGRKVVFRVTLKSVGAAAPTGKVTVQVGKKSVGKAKLKRSGKSYVAKVTIKKLKKKGKISVIYSGNKSLSKAKYATGLRAR
ncbi:phosphatase PAP2 family protein [Rarobacter incanus]|nr:phosphatase PAP2 family protein [Rarobacter incanus]